MHEVFVGGLVHIERKQANTQTPGFGEQQAPRIHSRVVGKQAGHKFGGVVGFEPGALVGGHRECCSVCFAKAERSKPLERRPNLVDGFLGVTLLSGLLFEESCYLWCEPRVFEVSSEFIGFSQAASGHHVENAQHVFVKNHHSVCLSKNGLEVGVQVFGSSEPVSAI